MRARFALYVAAVCVCGATILPAQDAVKVDPKHYTVVSENDQVRILKAHYGPHEKSVMHSHPNTVAVFISGAYGSFNFPQGKKRKFTVQASGSLEYARVNPMPRNIQRVPVALTILVMA